MKRYSLLSLLILSLTLASAQDFMFQNWTWNYAPAQSGMRWAEVQSMTAQELAETGFTYVWLPPLSRGSAGPLSMGYDPRDLYDLGEYVNANRYGTRAHLQRLLDSLELYDIEVIGDLVYNHRDGGAPDINPAVEGWIENYNSTKVDAGELPMPSDKFRCILPLGGNSGNDAGDYYFKFRSSSQHPNFYGKEYDVLMTTKRVGFQGNGFPESEPNGGGDCGEQSDVIYLGRPLTAELDAGGCGIDEFKLSIDTSMYDAAGDTLVILMYNTDAQGFGDFSDQYIYGLWSDAAQQDIQDQVLYQTYTDFTNMPSGQGAMNWQNFKPNGNPTNLNGDFDAMWFFYDYDQNVQSTRDGLFEWTKWMFEDVGIGGIRADAVKHFPPSFMGDLLDYLHSEGINPGMVVGEYFDYNPTTLKNWVDGVKANMDASTQQNINMRIFDFALRNNLEQACQNPNYYIRDLFQSGLVDDAGMSGFDVVTFLDNHDFDNEGHLITNNPELAYAYILTNNKLGVPCVFANHFYGPTNIRGHIKALMEGHKRYIFGSNQHDYLNRWGTPYNANFMAGDENKCLIYQMSGGVAGKDVVMAINFGNSTLRVQHELNMSNLQAGDTLTDIFLSSGSLWSVVDNSNRLMIEVPARSYGMWVSGDLRNEIIEVQNTTSIEQSLAGIHAIRSYPNPFEGQFRISMQSEIQGDAQLSIRDITGRTLYTQKLYIMPNENEFVIQQDLAEGMYLLEVEMNGMRWVEKMIAE